MADPLPKIGDKVRWPRWKLEQQKLSRLFRLWTVRGTVDDLVVVRRKAMKLETDAKTDGRTRWVYRLWSRWEWENWKKWERKDG